MSRARQAWRALLHADQALFRARAKGGPRAVERAEDRAREARAAFSAALAPLSARTDLTDEQGRA